MAKEQLSSSTAFSKEQIALARARISPLTFGQFLPGKETSDNPTPLTPSQVEKNCFAILGYLLEYTTASDSPPLLDFNSGEGLHGLEKQLDNLLNPPTPEREELSSNQPMFGSKISTPSDTKSLSPDETLSDHEKPSESTHQQLVRQRITDLFAYPQVRERFVQEFDEEVIHYKAAMEPMREIRTIDRLTIKCRESLHKIYLENRHYGKLPEMAADQIRFLQTKLTELEARAQGIEDTASSETFGYLETQQLLEYKRQLKKDGFVITPSRAKLLDRITHEALAGENIFLVGPTGTGKTELAFHVVESLTGGYEIVPWHEGTTNRDIFGYREIYEDETGKTKSGVKPGPYPRALANNVGLVHDEFTGGSTRTQLGMKYLLGARPGDRVQIPGLPGDVFKIPRNFIQIFTGNLKDERTIQREDMDPAILRELKGVEVGYMPASEMYDIIRASLIDENGILKLSVDQLDYIDRLTKAAEMMQRIHNRDFEGFPEEFKTVFNIDFKNNTETKLNANFLDPGTLLHLFSEWELASAKGQNFFDYMQQQLANFVNDPKTLNVPEERDTLKKILDTYELTMDEAETPDQEKGYVLPSQMAGETMLSDENPMGERKRKRRREVEHLSEIQREEQDAWEKVLGVKIPVAPLPKYITSDVKKRLAARGFSLRYLPQLDLSPASLKNKSAKEYLEEVNTTYPNWKPLESLSKDEQNDPSKVRQLPIAFWNQVKARTIDFPTLPGQWMAVEITPKKDEFDERFTETTSYNKVKKRIIESTDALKQKIGFIPNSLEDVRTEIRLLSPIEWNLLANRDNLNHEDDREWVEGESGGGQNMIMGYPGSREESIGFVQRFGSGTGVGYRLGISLPS